ncbi:hypothetical protein Hypma_010831 [Hypsizygus marmoreus]|uniref:Uncharacterized protein n=1 Tax=Hypsizygus marmoreus TaxID=39966 RepID=A0A369JII3_HYPMA|nr:hypothetical protein Hypma_010831 [Hypsizygus marmoreus]
MARTLLAYILLSFLSLSLVLAAPTPYTRSLTTREVRNVPSARGLIARLSVFQKRDDNTPPITGHSQTKSGTTLKRKPRNQKGRQGRGVAKDPKQITTHDTNQQVSTRDTKEYVRGMDDQEPMRAVEMACRGRGGTPEMRDGRLECSMDPEPHRRTPMVVRRT